MVILRAIVNLQSSLIFHFKLELFRKGPFLQWNELLYYQTVSLLLINEIKILFATALFTSSLCCYVLSVAFQIALSFPISDIKILSIFNELSNVHALALVKQINSVPKLTRTSVRHRLKNRFHARLHWFYTNLYTLHANQSTHIRLQPMCLSPKTSRCYVLNYLTQFFFCPILFCLLYVRAA